MRISGVIAALGFAASALAQQPAGFNYGSTNADGSCRTYADFKQLFQRAKNLAGHDFTSARLYTSIQCGTAAEPISAFRAAVDTNTEILVGLWASAGRAVYENELNALLKATRNLGQPFANKIVGISVGSEDLYRSSPEGKANNAGPGATGKEIEGYIGWMRDWIKGTRLQNKPIGHVDTWTAWVRPENAGVIKSVNWMGHNSFPYFETTKANGIARGKENFWQGVRTTESVSNGKPVWLTETGWPHRGPKSRDAVASKANASRYFKEVGCPTFGKRKMWWYTLVDANVAQTEMSFAVTPLDRATPNFNIQCPK